MLARMFLSITVIGSLMLAPQMLRAGEAGAITVYKNANCGCCGKWAQHLRDNGFTVDEKPMRSMAQVKQAYGVTKDLRSCHTGVVNGYVIEGHVPAKEIKKLLAEKPDVKGLAVPGMPVGSPGMEAPDGRTEKYDVLSFDEEGKTEVFASH